MGRLIVVAMIFGFFITSCKKPFERACFKSKGDEVVTEIMLTEAFDSLYLYDDIEYTLIPSNKSKVVLWGGENLLPFISIENRDGRLEIKDDNKCEFLRTYKHKIKADIYVDTIRFIWYGGSAFLRSKDVLYSNELRVTQREGAGEVALYVVNGYTSITIGSGYGNFYLAGNTLIGHLSCRSNSYADASSFIAEDKLIVNSNTVGVMKVNANTSKFSGTIHGSGNVEYFGKPLDKSLERIGKGEFIYLGE